MVTLGIAACSLYGFAFAIPLIIGYCIYEYLMHLKEKERERAKREYLSQFDLPTPPKLH